MKDEVFCLHDQWRICFSGMVPATTWASRGAAEAQLELLKSGYSEITQEGIIRHVGAKNEGK